MNLIYHMTRTAPRAIALENDKKKGSVSEGRTHRSHSVGETRTALLEMRTALLEMRTALLKMRTALLEMCTSLLERPTSKSISVYDKKKKLLLPNFVLSK